ncbi:ectoine synthase [Motiliproteus sp. MSK22-1]|uniref:ectoine synthase n=1 Tax=Motiliproteus sp. MSK22-1 TaxID=1897630 RepID=UPI000975C16B|nr:ectoine synthase [Motiliproteus sp. MSK22-1]OMH29138.1 L-ectoine synthase [Motiliproteus sp. MSK22-1]
MIVRDLISVANSERDIFWGAGRSRRFLIESDNMGYSLTDTVIEAGTESVLEYKNHMETCYCIEGEGWVENLDTGERFEIRPGVMYALDENDKHILAATKTMRLVCVFAPALKGFEAHNLSAAGESSSY